MIVINSNHPEGGALVEAKGDALYFAGKQAVLDAAAAPTLDL